MSKKSNNYIKRLRKCAALGQGGVPGELFEQFFGFDQVNQIDIRIQIAFYFSDGDWLLNKSDELLGLIEF